MSPTITTAARKQSRWFVYIVRCRDGSLYTGLTTDLKRRLKEHNSTPSGARYTRARRPVKLVYWEPAISRSCAAKREYQLKQLSAAAKRALIAESPDKKQLAAHIEEPPKREDPCQVKD